MERAADAAGLSRREVARRLIEGNRSPVGRLAGEHALEAFAFARETAPASLPALAEALKGSPRPGDPALAETDWEPVLSGAEARQQPGTGDFGRALDGRAAKWTGSIAADGGSTGRPRGQGVFDLDWLDRAAARRGGCGGEGTRDRVSRRRRDDCCDDQN